MIVAGFGFSSRASADDFAAAFARALVETAMDVGDISAIATLAEKANHSAFRTFARENGLPIIAIERNDPRHGGIKTTTRSARSLKERDLSSVAEWSALAALGARAGEASPRLLLPRIVIGSVTCAIASTEAADSETLAAGVPLP